MHAWAILSHPEHTGRENHVKANTLGNDSLGNPDAATSTKGVAEAPKVAKNKGIPYPSDILEGITTTTGDN